MTRTFYLRQIVRCAQFMQQISVQQRFANLEIVGAKVGDSVERSVDVVSDESGLESV